jgi:hypothetical protein
MHNSRGGAEFAPKKSRPSYKEPSFLLGRSSESGDVQGSTGSPWHLPDEANTGGSGDAFAH